MKEKGPLPCSVTLCIEGEEESGSVGLFHILDSLKDKIQADALLVVDVDIPQKDTPAVTLGCRGNVTMTIELTGSHSDLHSGMHGGIVFNPLNALVQMLGKMRDDEGLVLIDGFYDDVHVYSEEEKKEFLLDFDPAAYEKTFGAKPSGGEKAFSPIESCWMRPTLEINGLSGGYAGEGFKTVIPAKATAKISCRLVPKQNPQKILASLQKRVQELLPEGMKVKMTLHGQSSWAQADPGSLIVKAARAAYSEAFGKPCACILSGGSIPITARLSEVSGADILFVGYGLSDDNIHAPNEHYGSDRLIKLAAIIGATLENYANLSKINS
jgi:acetylornithine deacetylase/succinyl-diaminopimelate desuccinylase-like protein